ncbi:MAG: cbb3-type cytochrome c oxidase subunit 3 [Chlorobium sp.]|jgi:cbb3-type cytochrome oxidase subunit 3|nr:cbb3-type cytochrome c oxidase subunit 3 [Chlorobium sp.]
MNVSGLAYVLFTMVLAIISGGIMVYYYNPKRKERIEAPKQRMLDDDN